jgi:hypothetical protein
MQAKAAPTEIFLIPFILPEFAQKRSQCNHCADPIEAGAVACSTVVLFLNLTRKRLRGNGAEG